MDRWMDERMDSQVDAHIQLWIDKQMIDTQIDTQIDRQIDRQIDTQIQRYIDTQTHKYIDNQIDGQVNRYVDRWMDKSITVQESRNLNDALPGVGVLTPGKKSLPQTQPVIARMSQITGHGLRTRGEGKKDEIRHGKDHDRKREWGERENKNRKKEIIKTIRKDDSNQIDGSIDRPDE